MIELQQQEKKCLRNFFRLSRREGDKDEKKFVREMTSAPTHPVAQARHPSLQVERGRCNTPKYYLGADSVR